MHDFTIKELKEIRSCVDFEGYDDTKGENHNTHLLEKIDELITNHGSLDKIRERTWQRGGTIR